MPNSKDESPLKGIHPHGDKAQLHEILEEIVDSNLGVNSVGHKGMTPLHYATDLAADSQLDFIEPIIDKLLSLGAKINVVDEYGKLPLDYLSGAKALKRLLIKLTPESQADMTKVLFAAVFLDRSASDAEVPECLSVLESVANFGDYENYFKAGGKLVHAAASSGNLTAIKYMHKQGYDLNCKDKDLDQPIIIAAERGLTNTVSLLIELGVDPNTKGAGGNSSLHVAAGTYLPGNRAATIEKLIECGANTAQFNRDGDTPLHAAIAYGDKAGVKSLVKYGANTNLPNSAGEFPLTWAREMADQIIISFLIENGAVENTLK